jgi:Ca2+-transporting ATPase
MDPGHPVGSSIVHSHTLILAPRGRRARFRVLGLLGNPSLAARLVAEDPSRVDARTATGTVSVAIGAHDDARTWADRIDAIATAQARAPGGTRAGATARGARSIAGRAGTDGPAGPARRPAAPARVDAGAAAVRGRRAPVPASAVPPDDAPSADAPHARATAALLAALGDDGAPLDPSRGLASSQAAARLARDGRNEIRDVTGRSAAEILLGQFTSVPIGLLGASGALSLATRAYVDAGAIGTVLAANATLGFVTERRAEQTVTSLRKLAPRSATVVRDGEIRSIDAREVVVGDVLVLEPGEPVAADARVLEAHRLATNEAALTGESLPVRKSPVDALPAGTPLGERRNMVFLGTVVSGGTGRAVVVATAERAALGAIRRLAQAAEAPRTQLQEQLDVLGRRLAIGAAALCAGTFAIGLLRGRPALPLLRTAVSLGVAAIPEGLPTVATSLLASGIRSLQQRQVYARRLDAIENLGAVDTVCFDKTGTLTQNRMTVASLTIGRRLVMIDDARDAPALPDEWLRVAALCNAVEEADGAVGPDAPRWQGSSTELALLAFAAARGLDVDTLRDRLPPTSVRHRSEHHPYMVTLHAGQDGGTWVAVKGRPDEVLGRCEALHDGARIRPLRPADRKALLALNDRMAAEGHRVLALAHRDHPDTRYGDTGGLTWLGLVGLADPLRAGLPEMVARFDAAGIRTVMITGDQPGTARAVARGIGLDGGDGVVDAAALPESAERIGDAAERARGFARTSPAMKLEIVRALQQRGHVVAMTGDGINDGPALKTADVGVAMGVTGTDFAHAMSDLVLRDDHPAALLTAIEEGRTAFVNIRKSVRYLVATNLSELAATTLAVAAGAPEPFDPIQLLWTNIATDIWPAIALGLEPAEPGILERPPVSLREGLLDRREWGSVALDAGVMTVASLASFGYGLARYGAGPQARTLAFTTLTCSQLLYALSARSDRPLRTGGLRPNRLLHAGVATLLAAQAGTIVLPAARTLLRTTPVGVADLVVIAGASALPLAVRELSKELRAWRRT